MAESNLKNQEKEKGSTVPERIGVPPANLPLAEIEVPEAGADLNCVYGKNGYKKSRSEKIAARLPRHLRDLKPEEIFEPEQAPPAVPVTAAMKEEAAPLEALNLRPRHILPAAMRREMKYPAEPPSPRLANDFHRYHRKTLKAFTQARLPKLCPAEPAGYSFLRWLEKFTGLKKLGLSRRRVTTDHNITIILSYARRKLTITANEVATLLRVEPEQAARHLKRLTSNGDLICYSHGAKTYYQAVKH
ncbi:MAG: hypothetical protein MUC28_01325 [Planctomycetes bacterium]|jgi:hypothetical protein|nr:hypothetical protein [Planctomycetota bacterium]